MLDYCHYTSPLKFSFSWPPKLCHVDISVCTVLLLACYLPAILLGPVTPKPPPTSHIPNYALTAVLWAVRKRNKLHTLHYIRLYTSLNWVKIHVLNVICKKRRLTFKCMFRMLAPIHSYQHSPLVCSVLVQRHFLPLFLLQTTIYLTACWQYTRWMTFKANITCTMVFW